MKFSIAISIGLSVSCGGPYVADLDDWDRTCDTNFDCVIVPQTACSNECRIMTVSVDDEAELIDEVRQATDQCPLHDSTCRTQLSRVSVGCSEGECRIFDSEGSDMGVSVGALSFEDL